MTRSTTRQRPARKKRLDSRKAPDAKSRDVAEPGAVRLQKLLASSGAGSRRHCEEFILTGRVTIDGQTVRELGTRVDPEVHDVRLDGERLRVERSRYYAVHKPSGWLCTNSDPRGRSRVVDLCPRGRERLFTVGRLDENSTGLILVTNDGDLAHRLAHPRFRIRKVYEVQVAGVPARETLEQLQQGVYFAEGRFQVASAKLLRVKGQSAWVEVVLLEGQNREIRRLLARLGHKVQKLKRVALGSLCLGSLPVGAVRPLAADEIRELQSLAYERGIRRTAPPKQSRSRSRRGRQ